MPQFSPIVITIIAFAAILILLKIARKLIIHWFIFLLIILAIFIFWPKGLELLASFVITLREIIFKK